jgi:Arc/MetJ family transcription regulator
LQVSTQEVKTLIDVDEVALQAARAALGTTSKKDTVNKSLAQAAALAARRRDLERLTLGLLPDLEDDSIMASACLR